MIRRQLLKSTVTAVPVLLTGCLATTQGGSSGNEGGTVELDSSVNADEPTLSPGEKTSLQIDATDVLLLQVLLPYQNDEDGIEFGDTSVSPQPDRHLDVFPRSGSGRTPRT